MNKENLHSGGLGWKLSPDSEHANWLTTELMDRDKALVARHDILIKLRPECKSYIFVTLDLEFRYMPFEPSGMFPKPLQINDLPSVPSCSYRVYVVPRDDLLLLLVALNVASNYYWESCFANEQEFKQELVTMIRRIERVVEIELLESGESDLIIEFSRPISFENSEIIEKICLDGADGNFPAMGVEDYLCSGDERVSTRVFSEQILHLWWD